jgi:hypothetical protein
MLTGFIQKGENQEVTTKKHESPQKNPVRVDSCNFVVSL